MKQRSLKILSLVLYSRVVQAPASHFSTFVEFADRSLSKTVSEREKQCFRIFIGLHLI